MWRQWKYQFRRAQNLTIDACRMAPTEHTLPTRATRVVEKAAIVDKICQAPEMFWGRKTDPPSEGGSFSPDTLLNFRFRRPRAIASVRRYPTPFRKSLDTRTPRIMDDCGHRIIFKCPTLESSFRARGCIPFLEVFNFPRSHHFFSRKFAKKNGGSGENTSRNGIQPRAPGKIPPETE